MPAQDLRIAFAWWAGHARAQEHYLRGRVLPGSARSTGLLPGACRTLSAFPLEKPVVATKEAG